MRPERVEYLRGVLREHGDLDPIDLFRDKTGDWLGDGFHRVAAYTKEGRADIPARIHAGGRREAIEHGFTCNDVATRSSEDKRHSIRMALADPEWVKLTDNAIAHLCRVSNHLVAEVRTEEAGWNSPTSTRKGRDGKAYPSPIARVLSSLPPAVQAKVMTALEQDKPLPIEARNLNLGVGVKKRIKMVMCLGCGKRHTCEMSGCTQPVSRAEAHKLVDEFYDGLAA